MSDQEDDSVGRFHQEGEAFVLDPPLNQTDAARERRDNEQHQFAGAQVKTNRVIAFFTGALVLGTFIGSGIGIWQATISQAAAKAAKDAADASKRAVCVAQRTLAETERSNRAQQELNEGSRRLAAANFQEEQRAWISIKNDLQVTPSGILIHVENTGRTPAINVVINCCSFGDQSVYLPPPTFEQIAKRNSERRSKMPDSDAQVIASLRAHAKDSPEALRRYQDRVKLSEDYKKGHPVWKRHGVIGPNASPIYAISGGFNTISDIERASYVVGEITYNDIYSKRIHLTSICIVQTKLNPLGICGDGQKMD